MLARIFLSLYILLLVFFLGCAGTKGFLNGDMLMPDSPGPYVPDDYNPDHGNADPGDGKGGGWDNIRPHAMMMFYLGQRKNDRDSWDDIDSHLLSAIGSSPKETWTEFGILGVNIMSVVGEAPVKHGLGLDWAMLLTNMKRKKDSVYFDIGNSSGLTSMNYIDESIFIMEGQIAFRYVFFSNKWAWPFVRAGLGMQMATYDWKVYDPVLPKVAIERDGLGFGLGTVWGLGCLFAAGEFRAEIGFGLSIMKTAMDVDTEETIADVSDPANPVYYSFDTSNFVDDEETFRFGADPSFYIAIGGGF